jgi:hypothetical protein
MSRLFNHSDCQLQSWVDVYNILLEDSTTIHGANHLFLAEAVKDCITRKLYNSFSLMQSIGRLIVWPLAEKPGSRRLYVSILDNNSCKFELYLNYTSASQPEIITTCTPNCIFITLLDMLRQLSPCAIILRTEIHCDFRHERELWRLRECPK